MGLFSEAAIAAMSGGIKLPSPKGYKLPEIFPSFNKAKRVAIDIESHDPDINKFGPGWRRNAYLVGVSVAIQGNNGKIDFSEYYPCAHKGVANLDINKVLEWLSDELTFFNGEIVGANILYDADALCNKYGIVTPFAKFRDVQFAEPLIDENANSYKLNTLAQKYLGKTKVTDELKALYGNGYIYRFEEVHPGHARAYGLGDVILPIEILEEQYKELKKQKLSDLFDLECRLIPMLLYMRRKGQPIDLTAAEALRHFLNEKVKRCLQRATKVLNKRGFELTPDNFGKPDVLVTAFKHLGIEIPKTKKGHYSITDDWLSGFKHPFGRLLAAANKADKSKSTFVDGYIYDYQLNGRIFCEFHPLRKADDEEGNNGTVSGRFSSSNPNLQNLPTRDPIIGPKCRAMFIPEKGSEFFSLDWSQIEFRLLVNAAVERALTTKPQGKRPWDDKILEGLKTAFKAQEMYKNDPKTDFHNMVVKLTGLARKFSKSINFGIAFTMGEYKLAAELGLLEPDPDKPGQLRPSQKAKDIMKQYHENVPFVKAVQQATTKEADEDGYMATLLGRRTHFDLWEPRYQDRALGRPVPLPLSEAKAAYGDKLKRAMTHIALNRYTQGGGADMMKKAMVEIWESGILDNDTFIISLIVHDEFDGSVVPNKEGLEKLAEVKRIMENVIPLHVPILASCERGPNWSATH